MKVVSLSALHAGLLLFFVLAKSKEKLRKSGKNLVYVLTCNTSFTAPIFTKLTVAELHYVNVS